MKFILPLWLSRWLMVQWAYGIGYHFRWKLPDKGIGIFHFLFDVHENTLRVKYPRGWD